MKTLKECFVEALTKRGEKTVINSRSSRFTIFTRTGTDKYFYLGKAGALRTGPTIAKSIPVSDKFKKQLLEEVPQ